MRNVKNGYKEGLIQDNLNEDDIKEKYIVSSLVRGLQILSTFTSENPSLKVSEIAEINNMDQATVFRFIYTLEKLGYLVRDDDSKRYRQSVKMLTIGLPARDGLVVRHAAIPFITELNKAVRETVRLAVLNGLDVVNISVAEYSNRLYFRTRIGDRSPAFATSMGKVLLAYQPVEEWDRLISRINFEPFTEETITDPVEFREELMKVRQQGYAIQVNELIHGHSSIAVPIFDYTNKIVAGLDVTGLLAQINDEEKMEFYRTELLSFARKISEEMGHYQRF